MIDINFLVHKKYRINFFSLDISDQITNLELLTRNYLPDCVLEDNNKISDYQVIYKQSNERRLQHEDSRLTIFDDWHGKISLDLWHLLYSIIRLYYLKSNLYPIHAACVGIKKYVLLVGHSGVGKTTMLLHLINDLGGKIYSGNKTVISIDDTTGFNAVASTTAISLRQKDLIHYPNLNSKVVKFSDRAVLFLEKDLYLSGSKINISAIFIIKINDNNNETTFLDYPQNVHLIYPYFLDTVYADTVMCDGQDVFPGTITRDIQVHLAQSLRQNLSKIPVIKISGSVTYLLSQIKKYL